MHDPVDGVVERKSDPGERAWLLPAEGWLRRTGASLPLWEGRTASGREGFQAGSNAETSPPKGEVVQF